MPLLLTSLPDDALAHIAQRIVRNGEAYWFAASCRSARTATRKACQELKIEKPATRLHTVYASLPRLRAGLRLQPVINSLVANPDASGSEGLPRSMDGRLIWTPQALRCIVAGATRDVINYVWPTWMRITPTATWSALLLALKLGRIDLLDDMYKGELGAVLAKGLTGALPMEAFIKKQMIAAIVSSANHASAEWMYAKLEALSDAHEVYGWRTWFGDTRVSSKLVDAAVTAQSPYLSLHMFTDWVLPRFASRAPSERADVVEDAVHAALFEVTSGKALIGKRQQVWRWLSEAWPLGLGHLLRRLHSDNVGVLGVSVASLHRNTFRVRDLETYDWMREQLDAEGWLHDVVHCRSDVIPWTVQAELVPMRDRCSEHDPRYAFAHRVYDYVMYGTHPHSNEMVAEMRQRWNEGRAVWVEAYADILLYGPEPDTKLACMGLHVSPHAMCEALQLFARHATAERRALVFTALMPVLLAGMLHKQQESVEGAQQYDSDDDEQRSAAWEYISSLRNLYSSKHHDGGGRAKPVPAGE